MDKFSKYFLSGVFLLVMLLSMWFVMATLTVVTLVTPVDDGIVNGTYTFNATITGTSADNVTFYHNQSGSWTQFCINTTSGAGPFTCVNDTTNLPDGTYYFNATAKNDTTTVSDVSADVIVDNNNPSLSYTTGTETDDSGANRTWIFVNVTASDANNDTITFSLYNSTDLVNQTSYSDSYVTLTINWTGLTKEKVYYFNVTANDSATNEDSTATRTFYLDGIAPTASASCSPTTVYSGSSFPCTCSGTDATSGVSTTSGSSTSSDGTSTPTSTGTFTYTCTVTDNAGNEASATATYTVQGRSSGAVTTPSLPKKIHSWTLITPGVVTIMKDFDSEIGIKQIQIDVNNPAQNVKITVTKHDGKPAEVSVEKTGKVYQYLQIGAENFDNTLDKATVEFRVGRTWAAGVELEKNDIAVFRYNETASRWDELTTTSTGEDATYYYYDVELDEFSYFAISEKSVVSEEELILGVEKSKLWLWILVAVVIIAIIVWQMKIKKK
jgi:PGF-pre-PGF domain-containing protein